MTFLKISLVLYAVKLEFHDRNHSRRLPLKRPIHKAILEGVQHLLHKTEPDDTVPQKVDELLCHMLKDGSVHLEHITQSIKGTICVPVLSSIL